MRRRIAEGNGRQHRIGFGIERLVTDPCAEEDHDGWLIALIHPVDPDVEAGFEAVALEIAVSYTVLMMNPTQNDGPVTPSPS